MCTKVELETQGGCGNAGPWTRSRGCTGEGNVDTQALLPSKIHSNGEDMWILMHIVHEGMGCQQYESRFFLNPWMFCPRPKSFPEARGGP